MSTTLDAIRAGSLSYAYVAAIEGYGHLLCSGEPSAALTAWSGTDWTQALGGLFVDAQHEQQINPWEPFNSGGKCVLRVAQTTTADTFGVDTHRKGGSDETILVNELNRVNDTVTGTEIVTVKSTSLFDSTGEIHIGTECIAYGGKTSTTFTDITRGMYSPFAPEGSESDGTHFGNHHRVGFDAQSVKLQPVVSSIPRSWSGRRVGIWIHRVVNGVLDVKAQAHLVFAGRIVEIRDDPESLSTVAECEHVLDEVKEGSIGHNLWSAKIRAGVFLSAGMTFGMKDRPLQGAAYLSANALTVVASGATGANQLNEGYYTLDELLSKLEAWWTAELAAARLWGSYRIAISTAAGGEARTRIHWEIPGTAFSDVDFSLVMPEIVAAFLGFIGVQPTFAGNQGITIAGAGAANNEWIREGLRPPYRAIIYRGTAPTDLFSLNRIEVYDERGAFFDQFSYWPGSSGPPDPAGTSLDGWGVLLLDNKVTVQGHKNGSAIGTILPTLFQYAGTSRDAFRSFEGLPYEPGAPDYIEIRQVLILVRPLHELINRFFYSTGTAGFNHTTHDSLPAGMGLGIPNDLLGSDFEASVAALPGASSSTVLIVDEPTTMAELFGGDFVLRRAFTLWKESRLKFGTWRAPTSGDATHSLEESNKAEPAGNQTDHRSATAQTNEWARSVVKIDYNRDITAVEKDGGYRDSITFTDSTAVDDAGGRSKLFTIKARNTYGQFAATGVGVNTLAPGFLSFLPMVSRPAWKIRRSIDCRYFEGLSVGDVVLFSDEFARDPITGTRGIDARPALVTMHKWGLGGSTGGDAVDDMGGEVELFFTDVNPTLQSAPYAPAADVDYTAITSGYDAGYSSSETSLRCFSHHYSQIVEGTLNGSPIEIEDLWDAQRFVVGHKIKIIERDPLDPTSPIVWERTVASQAGNDIVLNSALSSPDWDPARKWRVVFDDYDAVASAQHAWAFQADDVDGLIQDTAQPYLYGSGTPPGAYEANPAQADQEHVELMPNIVLLEGAGRDVGYEKQLVRLTENLIDYKTTCAPFLFSTVLTNTTNVSGYQLVAATPIFLTWEILSPAVRREISVAPWFRSSDGTEVFIRVSIYRDAPHDTTLDDQSPGSVYDGAVWSTTSTTWQAPPPDVLFAEVKDFLGGAWLQIECSYKCETRGLAQFTEGPRTA